jgi:glucose-1-phosphate adenylyltransferase
MRSGQQKTIADVNRIACIVLAGGQGTRLFPLTQSRCKPAVAFGGRYRLIDIPMSHALNAHLPHIYVISQYMASTLHQHILETYQLDLMRSAQLVLLSPEETPQKKVWYNGTADAVRQNLEHFAATTADYFLILSGDQLYNMDLHELLLFAQEQDTDLVIASLPVEEREAKRMGLLKTDNTHRVVDFSEKPQSAEELKRFAVSPAFVEQYPDKDKNKQHFLGSMGIYVFKRQALFSLLREQGDDFGKELIPLQIKKGKTAAFVYRGYWEDIGTIHSYYQANLALINRKHCLNAYDETNPIFAHPCHLPSSLIRETVVKDSIVSQGAILEAKEIEKSIIGMRAQIKKGTVIRNSIIVGNHFYTSPAYQSPPLPHHFSIGENCEIEKAIIDEHCFIGNNVQLVNAKQLQSYDGDGIYIRDGIIIVTTGTKIPDHFVF